MAIFHTSTRQPEISASLHSDVLLPCVFSLANSKNELKYVIITWKANGVIIAQYMNGEVKASSRAEMLGSELQMGNASLILRNVSLNDKGDYECEVYEVPNLGTVKVSLKVTAAPQVFLNPKVIGFDRPVALECHAVGFYPPGNISVEWWSGSRPLPNQIPLQLYQIQDGSYRTVRHHIYTSFGMVVNDTLSCRVTHESQGGKPIVVPLQVCKPVMTVSPQTVTRGGKHNIVCKLEGCFSNAVISWINKNKSIKQYTCMSTWDCVNIITGEKKMDEFDELFCKAEVEGFDMNITQPVKIINQGGDRCPWITILVLFGVLLIISFCRVCLGVLQKVLMPRVLCITQI
ncbi:tapasin-related protein-like [Erpetoichthys calabaricus]|nr:tapasin-related protein-like [Erpetoichthys calabaricus]